MFDATAKFPSGILSGSTYNMGNFDECLQVKVPLQNDSFSGKYCLATLNFQPKADSEVSRDENPESDNLAAFNISVWKKLKVRH